MLAAPRPSSYVTSAETSDYNSYRNYYMRRIGSNGVCGDTPCHNGGIRRNSEWVVVHALCIRALHSPHGATGVDHLPDNLSQRLRRRQWNRNHDVDGVVEFHSPGQRDE